MKRAILIVVVLAAIAAGAYALWRFRSQSRANQASNFQTVVAQRGDLVASIGATGTVRANQTAALPWQTSGSVQLVNAAVGDQVEADQVLADLKETSLPQNIILAGVDLVNAKNDLDKLLEPPDPLALRQAEQAITQAEQNVQDLEDRVEALKSTGSQVDIDQAQATVVLAREKLEQAQQDFRPYANKPEDNLIRATLQNVLSQAQKEYDAAVTRLNNLLGTANDLDLAAAEADLALAKAQLVDARDKHAELLAGADPDDIAAAQARIAAAQATVDLKRLAAPFGGVITEVNNRPGDQVTPGTVAFRLDDLSRLLVDVQVSEVDINSVREGQDVVLTFDAIPTREYHGVVDQVAYVGTPAQGVVDFIVTVELSDADEVVKPGMTAAVNIAVNQVQDALLVPNRAVRVVDGQRVVYVLKEGVPTPVNITLGASSEIDSQVVESELQEGDLIVLNPPQQFERNGPPGFVGGGG
jgi:HlyD family secretion protein